jgi:hypothetical protein
VEGAAEGAAEEVAEVAGAAGARASSSVRWGGDGVARPHPPTLSSDVMCASEEKVFLSHP